MRPPILMVHGAFCGGWAFDNFRRYFAGHGYRTLAPDLRHHEFPPNGSSNSALADVSLRDYAADLENIVRGLEQTPILMGHSMGGLLCQMLAARGLARAAVLIAPSAPWGVVPSTAHEMFAAMGMFATGDFWNRTLFPSFRIAREHGLDRLPRGEQRETFARFVPESGRVTFEIMHWPLDMHRAAHVDARSVRCPVLALGFRHDRINPPETVRRIASRYGRNAEYLEMNEFGHWPLGEPGWNKVAQICHRWIDDTISLQAG